MELPFAPKLNCSDGANMYGKNTCKTFKAQSIKKGKEWWCLLSSSIKYIEPVCYCLVYDKKPY